MLNLHMENIPCTASRPFDSSRKPSAVNPTKSIVHKRWHDVPVRKLQIFCPKAPACPPTATRAEHLETQPDMTGVRD
jgi:hypothetical protein